MSRNICRQTILILYRYIRRYIECLFRNQAENQANLSGITNETIYNLQLIKGFSAENRFIKFYKDFLLKILKYERNSNFKIQFIIFFILLFFGILFYASLSYLESTASFRGFEASVLITYCGYLYILFSKFSAFISYFGIIQQDLSFIDRIYMVNDIEQQKCEKNTDLDIMSITIDELGKGFGSKSVVKDINLKLEKGSITGIIGKSGGGKSSFLKTVFGLYSKDKGKIIINKTKNVESLKSLFANDIVYIPQDATLFKGTIRENLELLSGISQISEDRIKNIFLRLKLYEVLKREKSILDTLIMENGNNLSGGEKQRIIFAVLLLISPKVILLDEITSQVDPQTEKIILDIVSEERKKGKIIVWIAHKVKFEEICDQIIDMNE